MAIEFRVLGPLEVLRDGVPMQPRSAKERLLLAVLLVHADRVVSVGALVDALWGENPPPTATGVLQTYISHVRKVLEPTSMPGRPQVLVRADPGYRLCVGPAGLDSARFERLVRDAREARRDGRIADTAELLRQALDLWRGPALADVADEESVRMEALRLDELKVVTIEDRVDADMALGRHGELVGELTALVTSHPLRERLWGQLIVCLYRMGRQADALAAYQQVRHRLGDELGLDPSTELARLETDILSHAPTLDWQSPERPSLRVPLADDALLPPVLLQASSMPFSGRRVEREVLAEGWARCRDGGFALVLLAGEPGIGKTRLVSEVAADARADGATVLAGRCDEDIRVPFGPFVESLRWMVDHVADDELPRRLGKHPGELVALVPEITERMPDVAPSAPADADTELLRVFEAVCSWLGSGGRHTSTVIVLDDLHWADTGTVQLLRHLVRAAPAGVLMLGTYRDTDISTTHPLAAALADLRQAAPVTRIRLGGLDNGEVRALVEVAGGQPLGVAGVAFADLVCAETAGNPLFVGEVLRHLADTGDVVFRDGRWTSERDLASIGIPEGIREVIGRRLSRLPSDTEAVLRTAAIIGYDFDLDLLATVVDRPDGETLSILEPAVTAALVTEVGVDRFRFAHALVRETLHSELTASRRARAHRRVAEAVERRHSPDVDNVAAVLALHWGEACAGGDPTVAVEWAARAGEMDLARRAPHEAARWFARALDLLAGEDQGSRRLSLLSRLAHAQTRAGDPAGDATARAAASLALDRGDVEAAAAALCRSVRRSYDGDQQPDEDKIALLDRTLATVGEAAVVLRGRLLAQLAGELVFVGDFRRRDAILDELDRLVDELEDPVERWGLMGKGTLGPGRRWSRPEAIERACNHCRAVATQLEDPFEREKVQLVLWPLSATLGDRESCDRAVSALDQEQTPTAEVSHHFFAMADAYLDGRFDDHARHATAIAQHLRAVRHPEEGTFRFGSTFAMCREQDRMVEVLPLVERWEPGRPWSPRTAIAALVHLLTGQQDLITLEGVDPVDFPDGTGWPVTVACTGEVAAAVGDDALVGRMLELVERYRGLHLVGGAFYHGSHDRLAALLHDRLGQHDEADQAFAAAVRGHHTLRTPVWAARTELDWAASLARRDHHDAARARVRAAQAAIGDLPLTESRRRAGELEALLA